MIYEVSFLSLRDLYALPWFVILFLLSRYTLNNELLSKKQKRKTIIWAGVILGTIPSFLLFVSLSAKVSLLTGGYKTYKGTFQRTEIDKRDGRTILLQVDGSVFKFDRYRSSCLNYRPKIKNSEVVEIKYYGYRHNACILSIKTVPS